MSLRDMIEVKPTHRQYMDDFDSSVRAVTSVRKGDEISCIGFAPTYEYVIQLRVFSCIRCNELQLQDRMREANQYILHELYKDVISEVRSAMSAVSSGNREAAMRSLAKAMDEMTKPELLEGE